MIKRNEELNVNIIYRSVIKENEPRRQFRIYIDDGKSIRTGAVVCVSMIEVRACTPVWETLILFIGVFVECSV